MNDAKAKAYEWAGVMLAEAAPRYISDLRRVVNDGDDEVSDEIVRIATALLRAAKARKESP